MQGAQYLNTFYHYVIDYIFSKRCMACAEPRQEGGGFCSTRWPEFEFVTKPFYKSCGRYFALNIADGHICLGCIKDPSSYDTERILLKFNKTSKKVIHAFKYYYTKVLAKNFAAMLCARYYG